MESGYGGLVNCLAGEQLAAGFQRGGAPRGALLDPGQRPRRLEDDVESFRFLRHRT